MSVRPVAPAGRRSSRRTGRPRDSGQSLAGLVVFLALVAVAGGVGAVAASSAGATYAALDRPPWAPPSWLFGPVWTVLYLMVAVAGWLVWRRQGVDSAVLCWLAQLVLNAAWTPLFFAAHRYGLALADVVVLDLVLFATVALAARRVRRAAALMVPYLAWTLFATALNAAVVVLN